MGLRFRKSITLTKGVKLNVGTKSASISLGTKGIHQSFSTTGKTTSTLSLPGTGLSYQKSTNLKKVAGKLTGASSAKKTTKTSAKAKTGSTAKTSTSAKNAKIAKAEAEQAAIQLQNDQQMVENFNALLTKIKSMHTVCDAPVDWSRDTTGLGKRILEGDVDAYLEAVESKDPYGDLLDYGADFEVGTDSPEFLEIEFRVKSEEVVPDYNLSLTSTGKVSNKAMGKTAYLDLVQDYVCSSILRTARDTFALLPVKKAVIHAVDTRLNTATGYEEEVTIVSVVFDRDRFLMLNFAMVDPSDALAAFPSHMNFKKTTGFEPVERLEA